MLGGENAEPGAELRGCKGPGSVEELEASERPLLRSSQQGGRGVLMSLPYFEGA